MSEHELGELRGTLNGLKELVATRFDMLEKKIDENIEAFAKRCEKVENRITFIENYRSRVIGWCTGATATVLTLYTIVKEMLSR